MSEVLSSNLLQKEDDPLHHLCPLLLQTEDGSRGANKHFGLAVGHVVFEPTTLQQTFHRLLIRRQVMVGPGELGDHLIPKR